MPVAGMPPPPPPFAGSLSNNAGPAQVERLQRFTHVGPIPRPRSFPRRTWGTILCCHGVCGGGGGVPAGAPAVQSPGAFGGCCALLWGGRSGQRPARAHPVAQCTSQMKSIKEAGNLRRIVGTHTFFLASDAPTETPRVTFRRVVAPLRGPGQSPGLPFACCVGSLRSVGCCGRRCCWCRFHVRGAQPLVCRGCAGCGGCRLRVSGAQ